MKSFAFRNWMPSWKDLKQELDAMMNAISTDHDNGYIENPEKKRASNNGNVIKLMPEALIPSMKPR